jgi:glutamate-1-semialdehyde 2,1-aminomutase
MTPIDAWPGSLSRWERAKASLGGGVSTGLRAQMKPHPLYFESGQGSRLLDVDGNTYIDYVLGWGPVIIGHAHPHLVETVSRQLPLGQTFGANHDLEYEIAERILTAIPGMERVLWSNSGSEANLQALRLVRAATGRSRFLKFAGHYHGWTDPMLQSYRPDATGALDGPATRGQGPRSREDVSVAPWNDIDAVRAILTDPAQDIAAVFAEPVLCNSGVIAPVDGFLAELREICDATGTLLVFDEVITGFRIALGGGTERFGVTPDLVILAKAVAGGFPMAALAGRGDLIDTVTRGVVHAGTYNGNPVVLSAAGATLDVLSEPGTFEGLESRGAALADGLRSAFGSAGREVAVHQVGPVVQVIPGRPHAETFEEFLAGDWALYDELTVALLRRGVFALPGGRWYLSTAHSAEDVEHTVAMMHDALGALG